MKPILLQTTYDQGLDPGIFILAVIFLSVAAGAVLVGALAASLVLSVAFILVSAGVISTAIFVGAYKRSVTAGFRTLLFIICPICGVIAGIAGLYLVNKIFVLHLSHSVIAWSGLIGGIAGGILLASVLGFFLSATLRFIQRIR